ncbi:unnamed protein product [Paramecium pentaurelia]|uniref:Uncharacterized protein n=1 Tax=Paramecium pentaurelia TaxID=43138 RepID=A0A8S1SZE4_9CILI|nr:unnamed protein product [Paramecium pentaurelia]
MMLSYLHSHIQNKTRESNIQQYKIQPIIPVAQIEKYRITKKQKTKTSKGKQKDEYQCDTCSFSFTLDSQEQ